MMSSHTPEVRQNEMQKHEETRKTKAGTGDIERETNPRDASAKSSAPAKLREAKAPSQPSTQNRATSILAPLRHTLPPAQQLARAANVSVVLTRECRRPPPAPPAPPVWLLLPCARERGLRKLCLCLGWLRV